MSKRQPDIPTLARWQRRLAWLALAYVVLFSAAFGTAAWTIVSVPLLLAAMLAMLASVVFAGWILRANGVHFLVVAVCALTMLLPGINLLLLVVVNMEATRILRDAGMQVGFMGVKAEYVERILRGELCRMCGYNLTGNVSGRCPECGKQTASEDPIA